MRISYIDETETDEFFIVCALTVESDFELEESFKSFKKKARNLSTKLKEKEKRKLFTEFKSVELDNKYPGIKRAMLNHIDLLDCNITYSCQRKSQPEMKFDEKKKLYITAIHEALDIIDKPKYVIFDYFKNKKFEQEIIDSFITDEKVLSIVPGDSKIYSGLKYVDNICSVIRRRINNNDKHNYYYLIEDKITK